MADKDEQFMRDIYRELGELKTLVTEVRRNQDGTIKHVLKVQGRHASDIESLKASRRTFYSISAFISGIATFCANIFIRGH